MLEFLSLKPKAFALDISDLSLKIVNLKKKGKFLSLASWEEVEIKPGIVEEGEIKDEDALSKIIKESLGKVKGKRLETRNAVASLPEKKAFLQVIQMPKMKKEELEKAILFEAENYIPLPIEEVYLDFQVIPPAHGHSDHLDLLIAALPKETTDPYVSCLKKAGLTPLALEIESQSISRALVKNRLSPYPLLLIDFGRTRTTLIIFSGHSLRFTSTIPVSSQKLTEAISRTLKKDLGEAEKLKIKYGLEVLKRNQLSKEKRIPESRKRIEKNEIFEAMIPVLTDLVKQIKKYIGYYQTHASNEHLSSSSRKVEKILLCGRGANLKGLTDFLSFEFKIPVELGNPWINILPAPLKEVPELSFKESLGFTSVLGLALRGIRGE